MSIKSMHRKKLYKVETFDIINIIILTVWGLVIVYPFYNAVLISLIPQVDYVRNPFMLFPKHIVFDSYKYILQGSRLWVGYRTTFIILLIGLPYNLLLTLSTAYVLSRDRFPGKKIIVFFIYFTMFFQGGLIPLYLVVKSLGLTNTIWSVILIMGINTFYMIILRTYFETIPESLVEAAKIDGANDIKVLFEIMIPLAKPIIATLLLFYAVDRWNEWFNAMIFIKKASITPLQLILRNIIFTEYSSMSTSAASVDKSNTFNDGIKMASIVITMAPIMIFYPFVQKYFVKGLLIGSVKS